MSDRKLADELGRLGVRPPGESIFSRLQFSAGINLGVVSFSVQPQPAARPERDLDQAVRMIDGIEGELRQRSQVGDLAARDGWVSGRVRMSWEPMANGQTVLFCGHDGAQLVVLAGSVGHMVTAASSAARDVSWQSAIRQAVLDGDSAEHLGRNLAAIADEVRANPTLVRFLAQVIDTGPLPGGGPRQDFLLATPLYVEHANRQDEPRTAGQPLRAEDPIQIGRYQVLSRLGVGSMGVVYQARDNDGALVAIKVINPDLIQDPVFLQRFRGEAEYARRIRSPNVARVIAAEMTGGHPYLVTEFVDGLTLKDYVARNGPLRPDHARDVAAQVATGLAAIHAAGVVHRDLAPANIILSGAAAKIIDFGLARAAGTQQGFTQIGQLTGTLPYASPEQISQAEITPASDVFSWGGVTVFAATGHPPFGGRDVHPARLLDEIRHGVPNLDSLPPDLRGIVTHALGKTPAQRPPAQQVVAGLQAGIPDSAPADGTTPGARDEAGVLTPAGGRPGRWPTPPPGSRRWLGAAVIVVVAVAGYILAIHPGPGASPGHSHSSTSPSVTSPPPSAVAGTGPVTGAAPARGKPLTPTVSGAAITGVTTGPDGTTAVAVSSNSGVTTRQEIALFRPGGGYQAPVPDSANPSDYPEEPSFDPKDGNLVAYNQKTSIEVYDRATRNYRRIRDPSGAVVTAVAYSGNGEDLVEADDKSYVYVLNASSGHIVQPYSTGSSYSGTYSNLSFGNLSVSQSANVVAAAENDVVWVWRPQSGPADLINDATDDAVSPDGSSVAVTIGGEVQIWNAATQSLGPALAGGGEDAQVLAFSPDGKTLAVGDSNGHIYLWNLKTGRPVTVKCGIQNWGGLAFSPNGKTLTVYGSDASQAYVYDVRY